MQVVLRVPDKLFELVAESTSIRGPDIGQHVARRGVVLLVEKERHGVLVDGQHHVVARSPEPGAGAAHAAEEVDDFHFASVLFKHIKHINTYIKPYKLIHEYP